MGMARVPFCSLLDGEVHECWIDIDVPNGIAKKQRASAVTPKVSAPLVEVYLTLTLVQLRVRLRYAYSPLGEFFAHFLQPHDPEPDLGPEFDHAVLLVTPKLCGG